jgi:predicted nuclease of predicted toxin-antitoxin system
MRLVLDACVWGGAVAALRGAGYQVEWAGEWEPGLPDDTVLERARERGAITITLDKDFGELAVVFDRPHAGIVRLVGLGARQQADACIAVLARYAAELRQGALVTVQPGRVRIRPAAPRHP